MQVKLLITGGTIDKVYDRKLEAMAFSEISAMPALLAEANVHDVDCDVLMLKDSLEMDDTDRDAILKAAKETSEDRLVITHGTGTMTVTASYLHDKITDKTIVLTGAMRPLSIGKSDAQFNVGFALAAAKLLPAGIYIAMNGQIFEPGKVIKNVEKGIFETLS